jgi:hypothetical protein
MTVRLPTPRLGDWGASNLARSAQPSGNAPLFGKRCHAPTEVKCGIHRNVLRFLAPLVSSEADIAEALAILDQAIAKSSETPGKAPPASQAGATGASVA